MTEDLACGGWRGRPILAAGRSADGALARRRRAIGLTGGLVVSACGAGLLAGAGPVRAQAAPGRAPAGPGSGSAPATPGGRTLLVVGDSLSAEYGLGRGEGWVALLEARLAREAAGRGWRVVNASISGDTTAGGLARLPALLERHAPALTLIELGGNDALRGLQMAATEANLRRMVTLSRTAGSKVLLVGMMLPPNFGAAYGRQFAGVFRRIAESEQVALVPFLLDGFGEDPAWFQPDRIHPLAKAQPRMLDNVWPVLSAML